MPKNVTNVQPAISKQTNLTRARGVAQNWQSIVHHLAEDGTSVQNKPKKSDRKKAQQEVSKIFQDAFKSATKNAPATLNNIHSHLKANRSYTRLLIASEQINSLIGDMKDFFRDLDGDNVEKFFDKDLKDLSQEVEQSVRRLKEARGSLSKILTEAKTTVQDFVFVQNEISTVNSRDPRLAAADHAPGSRTATLIGASERYGADYKSDAPKEEKISRLETLSDRIESRSEQVQDTLTQELRNMHTLRRNVLEPLEALGDELELLSEQIGDTFDPKTEKTELILGHLDTIIDKMNSHGALLEEVILDIAAER